MKTFYTCFCLSMLLVSAGFAFSKGIVREEMRQCYKAQEYEGQYPLYETSTTTSARCKGLGINVHEFID